MKAISCLSLVISLFFVTGCENNELTSVPHGDYMPIHVERHLLREQFPKPDLSERYFYDTIRVSFRSDTVIGTKSYQVFQFFSIHETGVHRDVYKIFRREGSKYLDPPLSGESEERVFLDIDQPIGGSWSYDGHGGNIKTTYTIKSFVPVKIVNGIEYRNVVGVELEVQVKDNDGRYYRSHRAEKYYAKDFGEIYVESSWYVYAGAMRLSAVK